jgi:hypothetical protein
LAQNDLVEIAFITVLLRKTPKRIIDCIDKSGLDGSRIDDLIHGSTVAINTLIIISEDP